MKEAYGELYNLFSRTKADIQTFNGILQPVVDAATNERERLYFHHILEEEEQRLERLDILLPMLKQALGGEMNNLQFIQLLEELNLEKFGLHNFREHLDLALFEFQDEARQLELSTMRERTQTDYLKVKDYLNSFNQEFLSLPTVDSKETPHHSTTTETKTAPTKRLTVGSLKNMK